MKLVCGLAAAPGMRCGRPLTLLLCREILNAHRRRRRQSNLKYGQGLQGEAPQFLYHLAIIVIKRALRKNHIAATQRKKDIGDFTMLDAQTRDPAGSHVVACMRPWTIALPSWILPPLTVSKEAIRDPVAASASGVHFRLHSTAVYTYPLTATPLVADLLL